MNFFAGDNPPKPLPTPHWFSADGVAPAYSSGKAKRRLLRLSFAAILLIQLLTVSLSWGQVQVSLGRDVVRLEATRQRREGDLYIADGDVDVRYLGMRMRADHIEYNSKTYDMLARGHVIFDYMTQHLEGPEAHYNVRSDQGVFLHVRGTINVARRPNQNVLLSTNPISFESEEVDRLAEDKYVFKKAWLTVCMPNRPVWKFYSERSTLKVDDKVVLVRANFRLLKIPLIYLPYASIPASPKVRQSGFLMPGLSDNNVFGLVVGDSYYWAPTDWMDAEVGAQYLSLRGWAQSLDVRAVPDPKINFGLHYYGVEDRGLPGPNGTLFPEGGSQAHLLFTDDFADGWRAVADVDYLSSLTFRLAFSTTFNEATASELHQDAFLTKNFRGFSLNFAALDYKDFISAQPETSITLRSAPEVRFGTTDRPFWSEWPVYFGLDSVVGGMHRADTLIDTGQFVERSEVAPRVTLPLRWGSWFGITSTAGYRMTDYGEQLANETPLAQRLLRRDGELSVEMRPPALERIWDRGKTKWKHVIEPNIVYNYVTGINDFSRIILFDQGDTITDTSEMESSVTQRLFRKTGDGQAEEFLTWRVAAKYYFDPTFGGALVPGERNVFAALDSLTPFAFADGSRHWSPIVSLVKMSYNPRYDIQLETDYDPVLNKMAAVGLIATLRPYQQSFFSLAQFRLNTDPILLGINNPFSGPSVSSQPLQDQIRVTAGWGQMNRKGWNTAVAIAYDTIQHALQYEAVQASYNGSCCGISFEYRRIYLGALSNSNEFRASLLIANIGTFGNLTRQERLF